MPIYKGTTELTKIADFLTATEHDITEVYFGDKQIFTAWAEYDGTLPAQYSANGDYLADYRVYGANGGVGEEVDITGLSEPLCGIGAYTDSLDLSTGALARRIKKLVIKGNEEWTIRTGQPSNVYFIEFRSTNFIRNIALCTHYINQDSGSFNQIEDKHCLVDLSSDGIRSFIGVRDSSYKSTAAFKSYLAAQYAAGTPVIFWYALANEETATIPIPSGLTGTIEGYLIQDGTPTPQTPIYPNANGVKQADDTYSIKYGYKLDMGIRSANLFDYSDLETGSISVSDGTNVNNSAQKRTAHYINVSPSSQYKIRNANGSIRVHEYTLSNAWIRSILISIDATYVASSNTAKIRLAAMSESFDAQILLCQFFTTTPIYIGSEPLGEDEYVDYGEQKVYKHKTLKDIGDTVSVNGDLWDIVNYNNDFTRATLLRHETMSDMVYGARQAIYAFPNGLAAGDYHFTIAQHSWVAGDVGKTLTFTLTQAIPDGGQLVLNVAYNATLVGTTISSYASPTTTTAIEAVTMTEGDSGTDLGSLTNAGTPASNINSFQKALLGSNEWKTSALRQYLNSDKAAGRVWIPQTIFDRPPVWAINTAGFMNGLDEDFLSCVADATYVTARNAMSDGGGTDTLTDKFYLPSKTEIFGDNEIANTPEGTLYQYYVNATNSDRIKYRANTARSWRLRTPSATNANIVRSVYTSGAFSNNNAYIALGFAPACQIDLTKLNNSWILANFYKPTLTPTDPPVPLPALPTVDGTNIVDYAGQSAAVPSRFVAKYRKEDY